MVNLHHWANKSSCVAVTEKHRGSVNIVLGQLLNYEALLSFFFLFLTFFFPLSSSG